MTNPYATIALTFGGTDIQESPIGIFLEIVRGLNEVPQVRGTDTVVPGLAGRIPRSRVGDRLTIELRGHIAGIGANDATRQDDFRTRVMAVRALFDPRSMPADLVAELEDGSTATIAARTMNIVPDQVHPSVAKISIELESVSPDWSIVPPP